MRATLVFSIPLLVVAQAPAFAAPTCAARSGAVTVPLVELYTSEGCSSCPPADRWFSGLAASSDPKRLSLLGFHVDYWDDIGWPDRFASHAYTQRQDARVRAGGSATVYTPQIMFGARLDQRWYHPQEVAAAIRTEQERPSRVGLSLSAHRQANLVLVEVRAMPLMPLPASAQLFLAMYENGLTSVVGAGENRGVTLHHDRVVRGLWGPWPLTGVGRDLRITPPGKATTTTLGLTAFVQDARGETWQALSLPLTDCAAP